MKDIDLVIIPGAYPYFVKKNIRLKHLFDIVYKYFEIKPHSDKKFRELQRKFRKHYKVVHFIKYKRKIHELIDPKNTKKVLNDINKVKRNYDLLCFSYGGYITQRILNRLKTKPNKIVFVGSLNLNKNISFDKKMKIINIYSKDDILIKSIIDVVAKKQGSQKLKYANVNIELEGLSHSEVELDYNIPKGRHKGKRTYSIIKKNLLED